MARRSWRAFLSGLFGTVTTEAAASSLGSECLRAFREFIACDSMDGVADVLLGLVGPAASLVGLLGLGSLIEGFQRRRELRGVTDEMRGEFRAVHERLEALAAARATDAEWIDLADELLSQRLGDREPSAALADLADAMRAAGVATQESVDEWFRGVTVFLSNIDSRLRRVDQNVERVLEGQDRIEAALPQIADGQLWVIESLAATNERLPEQNTMLHGENTSLREQLINANRELGAQKLAEGRSVDEVLAELRDKSPFELFEFLRSTVVDEEAEFAQRRDKLIERHREIAAIGYPLGKIDEARASLLRILDLVPNDLDAINRIGLIEKLRGNLDEAQRRYARVLELAPDEASRAVALGNLGQIEETRGNLDTAEDYHKRSLAIDEELGRKEGMANQLGNLGLIEGRRGNLDAAEDYHKRALAINEELGSKEGMAADLSNLGLIERRRGNLDAAEDSHKRSLAINEQLPRKKGIANQLGNLGVIEWTRGNLDAAEDYHKRSYAIEEELGRKEGMAIQLGNLGGVAKQRGDVDRARELWTRDLFAEIGMWRAAAKVQCAIDGLDG